MKRLSVIFGLFLSHLVPAQNLVLNPSFEQQDSCAQGIGWFFVTTDWYVPMNIVGGWNTPELFHPCSVDMTSVPTNVYGTQEPHEGQAYAGIALDHYDGQSVYGYREYITGSLAHALDSGQVYCVTLYVSNVQWSTIATDNIGIFFSSDKFPSCYIDFTCQPQVASAAGNFITGTEEWTQISSYFQATGGEKFFTIGKFNNPAVTDTVVTRLPNNTPILYYYIDDVSVEECDSLVPQPLGPVWIPNVITPNFDDFNENFVIQNLPPNSTLYIYSRWGNLIYQNDNYENNWNSGNHSAGVYFYLLETPNGKQYKGTVVVIK